MGTEQRPYIGTWKLNQKKVVQHTPDCLVYINGDLTIPGVDTKGQQYRIDLQKFITGVQVDCANTPSGASANISLSIPTHSNEPFSRDANNILTTGLEVHIYMRGYFPVRGLFRGAGDNVAVYDDDGNLRTGEFSEDQVQGSGLSNENFQENATTDTPSFPLEEGDLIIPQWVKDKADGVNNANPATMTLDEIQQWADDMGIPVDLLVIAITLESESSPGKPDADLIVSSILNRLLSDGYSNNAWEVVTNKNGNVNVTGKQSDSSNGGSRQYSTKQWYTLVNYDGRDNNGMTAAFNKIAQVLQDRENGTVYHNTNFFHWGSQLALHNREKDAGGQIKHSHPNAVKNRWVNGGLNLIPQSLDDNIWIFGNEKEFPTSGVYDFSAQSQSILNTSTSFTSFALGEGTNRTENIGQGNLRPKTRYDDLFAYPYYHVFHGVITNVSFSYSPGIQTATLACGSMLHFWSYQNMSTNASVFGARPSNSKNRVSLLGHNFTGQHPYEIIYTLFHDTAGAAGSVNFVMGQKTNVDSVLGENSLYSLTIKYWEERFSQRIMNLRLHGATGALYNTLQATAMAKISTQEMQSAFNNRSPRLGGQGGSSPIMSGLSSLGLVETRSSATNSADQGKQATAQATAQAQGQTPSSAQLDQASFGNSGGFKGDKPLDLNVFMMEAYVKDIGQIASINLFESSYETKMDIANKVCEITGFEFYQDVDGDCVFKPPMYNLDTSSSRVYRIEDIDMISWSESEKEPETTFMVTKGSQFANLAGTGVDGEWGVQGTFIDYPLVAKYGWRSGSFETAYFNDARQCFFASINRMAVLNASVNSGSCSIPIRPEMRPGYPIYVPSYDCFYYCTSISHSYQVGGACQTTLQLVAKRKKFYAPGDPNKSGIESIHLDGFSLPPKPLQVLRKDGYTELSGFPNVVMTLDPNLTNPMFYVSGADFESLTNEENLEGLLKILAQTSIEGNTFTYEEKTKTFSWRQNESETKYFTFDSEKGTTNSSNRFGSGTETNPYNLFASAGTKDERRLSERDSKYNQEIASQGQKVAIISDQINQILESKRSISPGDENGNEEAVRDWKQQQEYDKRLTILRAKLKKEGKALRDLQNPDNAPQSSNRKLFTPSAKGIDYLMEMLSLVRRYGKYDSDRFNKDWKNLESSSNLLDLISNKKANLSNGQIPGSYRYYSSAHPDPEHQGKKIGYANSGDNGEVATPFGEGAPLGIPKNAPQYLPTTNITVPDPFYQQPEAELRESAIVTNGIPLIGADGKEQVTPTDEIFSLRFQKVKGKVRSQAWRRVYNFNRTLLTEEDFYNGLESVLRDQRYDSAVDHIPDILKKYRIEIGTQRELSLDIGGTASIQSTLASAYPIYTLLDFYYLKSFEEKWYSQKDGFSSSKWSGFRISSLEQAFSSITGEQYGKAVVFHRSGPYSYQGNTITALQDFFEITDHTGKWVSTSPIIPTGNSTSDKYGSPLYHLTRFLIPIDGALNQIGCTLDMQTSLSEPTDNVVINASNTVKVERKSSNLRHSVLQRQGEFFDLSANARPPDDALTYYVSYNDLVLRASSIGTIGPMIKLSFGGGTDEWWETGKLFFNNTVTTLSQFNQQYGVYPGDRFSGPDFVDFLRKYTLGSMARTYYQYYQDLADEYGGSTSTMRPLVDFVMEAFNITKDPISSRMANVWEWKDITSQVPVFPISDAKGYEVFGHYPYGRGLDIFANNPLDTILQTDPFIGVDCKTIENYILALQNKTVTITDEQGGQQTLSGTVAITESSRQLEIALKNEYSPQELLDYGLATLNANNMLQISVQNWLADKSRDGVQKVTVENRAFSIADLGFLSDLSSLPSDLKSSQSDVLLPAYSDNFADIIMTSSSSNSVTLLDQLLETTSSGEPKTIDMIHSIVNQENRSANWSQSQSALRGVSLETQNSADILRDTVDTLSDNFDRVVQQSSDSLTQAYSEQQRAKDILSVANQDLNTDIGET